MRHTGKDSHPIADSHEDTGVPRSNVKMVHINPEDGKAWEAHGNDETRHSSGKWGGYFDNGASSKIDDVLAEDGGLLYVLPLAVHLNFFWQTSKVDYSMSTWIFFMDK